MSTAFINHNIMEWARIRSGISVDELVQSLSSKYLEWEKGQIKPTFKQAQALAKKLHIPFGYLSSEDEATQNSMSDIANWTMRHDNFKDTAKSEFPSVADPWIIAKAKTDNLTVVTQEKSKPESKSKIFIPDVCNAFDVNYINTIEMLRILGRKF